MKEINLLKELARRFIHDVKRNLSLSEAGWMDKKYVVKELPFVEEKNGNVRISIKEISSSKFRGSKFRGLDGEAKWLFGLCLDMSRMGEARELLVKIVERFDDFPQVEGSVVALGWKEMLKGAGECVALDRVLKAGLNAVQWFAELPKASIELALSVAKKWWNVKLDDVKELSEELNLGFSYSSISIDIVKRIKHVLAWDKALDEFSKDQSEALGLLWFADMLLVYKGVSLPEAIVPMEEKTWESISKRTKRNEPEILQTIEKITNRLSDATIDWAGILRLPW